MRLTSSLLAIFAGLTLSMAGCGGDMSEPEQAPASESISVDPQRPEGDVTQQALCPLKWYCDTTRRYYNTSELCAAACGSVACYREHQCGGGCLCP